MARCIVPDDHEGTRYYPYLSARSFLDLLEEQLGSELLPQGGSAGGRRPGASATCGARLIVQPITEAS